MNKTTYPEHLVGKEVYVRTGAFYFRRSQIDPSRVMSLKDINTHLQNYFNTGEWSSFSICKKDFYVFDNEGGSYHLDGSVYAKVGCRPQIHSEATGFYLGSITGVLDEVSEV